MHIGGNQRRHVLIKSSQNFELAVIQPRPAEYSYSKACLARHLNVHHCYLEIAGAKREFHSFCVNDCHSKAFSGATQPSERKKQWTKLLIMPLQQL